MSNIELVVLGAYDFHVHSILKRHNVRGFTVSKSKFQTPWLPSVKWQRTCNSFPEKEIAATFSFSVLV